MNLRKLLSVAFATCLSPAYAQFTVFQETMGTVSANTTLVQHCLQNGFDNDAYVFDDGNAATPVDVRNSSASSGAYVLCDSSAASGGANLWFGGGGERGFSITGVRAAAFDSLELYFAYRKESASTNADFRIDWSIDAGQNWDSVSLPGFLPNANVSTGWYYIGPVSLPAAASENTLALRWIKTNGSMRLDDIQLIGHVSSPFLRCDISSLSFSSYADYTPSAGQYINMEAFAFQQGDSINVHTIAPFSISKDTQFWSEYLLLLPDSNFYSQSLMIRMEASEVRGDYMESLIFYASNALDTLQLNLEGISHYAGEEIVAWECDTNWLIITPEGCEFSTFEQGNNYGTTPFISGSVSSGSYTGASGGNNAGLAVTIGTFDPNTSAFIGWYLVPDNEREVHLLGLSFGARSTSSGPQSWCLRSSADGFSSNLYTGSLSANTTWSYIETNGDTVSLSFSDSTCFRLYLYGGTGTASINVANFRLDDLELNLAIWNDPSLTGFRSAGSGNFHDSSLWTYNYYDTLYRNAYQIPGDQPSIHIRQQDSLGLAHSDTLYSLLLDGQLALGAKDLHLQGALTGTGEMIGHPASGLYFYGNGDSSVLRLSSNDPKQSNGLSSLTLDCPNGYVDLSDTTYIHHWVHLEEGTLISAVTLHLLQGQSSAAQILPYGEGSISGALCMQTMIPGQSAGWRSLLSPLDTVSPGQLGTQIELHLNNTASSGDNRNAFVWTESTASWNVLNDPSVNLHEQPVNVYIFDPDSSVIQFCGLYDTSEVSFGSLSFTQGNAQIEGWHLLGNPFPAPLRWSEVNLPNGANGNYAVWSEADGNYRSWNGAVGAAGDLIPPFQGFWVKVNQELSEDLIVRKSYCDTGQVNHFGKKADISWQLNIRISGNSRYSDAVDVFHSGDSSLPFTHAPKLFGLVSAPQIWVDQHAKAWSIWRCQGEEKIPITLQIPDPGPYRLYISTPSHALLEWVLMDEKSGIAYPIISGQTNLPLLEKGIHSQRFYLQKKAVGLNEIYNYPLPEVLVYDRFIHIKTEGIETIDILQPDGKMLHTYPGIVFNGYMQFGPLPYAAGIYILRYLCHGTTLSQLIYLQ